MSIWRKHLFVTVAYTLLALAMSYPLALNFASALPGVEGDSASFLWGLGWMKTALLDLRVNPFQTDYVFYPLGGATQLMWAVSLVAFVSIPLQSLFGLIASYNLLYLTATALTAYGMFLLADDVLQNSEFGIRKLEFDSTPLPPFQTFLLFKFVIEQRRLALRPSLLAPFAAGLVFAFAPLRLGYGLSFFNLFNTQFIPFFVLFLIRATREKSRRDAILAGIFFGANAYIDFQIAAFLLLLSLLFAAFVSFSDWRAARAALARWGVAALAALILAAPMLTLLANDFAREGGNYIRVFPLKYSADRSYDLLSFFVPHARSALYAGAPLKIAGINAPMRPGDDATLAPDFQAFAGYVVLALAAYATVRHWRAARFWFFAAILFWLLSLGPSLRILGADTGIPLLHRLLYQIPILNHIRIPMRYGIMAMFALAMLAAIGIRNWELGIRNSLPPRRMWNLRWLLAAIILLEYVIFPFPINPIPAPGIYSDIARIPGDFTILEIPTFNWRAAAYAEAFQPIHGKRILRAYTNRIAPGIAEYFGTRGIPIVVRALRALEGAEPVTLPDDEIAEDRQARDEVLRFFDVRYAVMHRHFLKPEETLRIDAYLREVLGARAIYDDGETAGYRLPRPAAAPGARRIDLRENIGQMYAGRGWQFEYPPANWNGEFNFVWARGAQSEIFFVEESARDRAMTLRAFADPPQRVRVSLNGARIGEIALTAEWKDIRIALPARLLSSKMNTVRLEYDTELQEIVGVTTIEIE